MIVMRDVILPDPDYEGFNGVYVGTKETINKPCEYNLSALLAYLRENNRELKELKPEELERFKLY